MRINTILMSVLLSCLMFSACSSDDDININGGGETVLIPDDGVVLTPVELYDIHLGFRYSKTLEMGRISEFFDKELPKGMHSDGFFVDSDQDECYVINSPEELSSLYKGDMEIPEIDFEQYTLVLGQLVEPDAFDPVLKQDIEFHDNRCHLTLYVPNLEKVNLNGSYYKTQYLYHWALYPKFNTEGISVGFIKEGALQFVENVTGGHMTQIYDLQFDPKRWHIKNFNSDLWQTYCYYPFNLPDVFKEEELLVSISGYIFEPGAELYYIGSQYDYYIYLTNIEKTD